VATLGRLTQRVAPCLAIPGRRSADPVVSSVRTVEAPSFGVTATPLRKMSPPVNITVEGSIMTAFATLKGAVPSSFRRSRR
jgi:hypothetical protein